MKFVKENNGVDVKIPRAALRLSGIGEAKELELLPFPKMVLTLPSEMTAQDMLTMLTGLRMAEEELKNCLIDACEFAQILPGHGDDACRFYALDRLSEDIGESFEDFGSQTELEARDTSGALLDELQVRGMCMAGLFELLLGGEDVYG